MRRHNEIQRAHRDCTKKCLGLSDKAGTTAGTDLVAPKRVIANISVIVGAETLWIDVSVVDPGCHHFIERYRSNEVPDAAAKGTYGDNIAEPIPTPTRIHHHPLRARKLKKTRTFRRWIHPADQRRTRLLEALILERNQFYFFAIYSGKMLEAKREWMWANPHKWIAYFLNARFACFIALSNLFHSAMCYKF